ncbi:hypothetical protein [Planctomyces sp. SH-PL62]|uniref:hypothetical protein n=1 Tax=Planctomyces sp. SH-PL62 TaxID=1636152 RepID=UPI00078CC0A3|nr:hypothetical protein [Planctomyces sp. SH-PL62]AMV39249.1 hypothetical protein VT85_17560 [Planctomyces sp. SH-PL62]
MPVTHSARLIGALAGLILTFGLAVAAQEPKTVEKMILASYDGEDVPRNKAGDQYPNQGAYNPGRDEGGEGTLSLDGRNSIAGKSLLLRLTKGKLYLQFNPYQSVTREFARDYTSNPAAWRYDTYNRLRFWIRLPTNHPFMRKDAGYNIEFGTYVKTIANPDKYSDETGGGHFYHQVNAPATGSWTQVIINMNPDHRRGDDGHVDRGSQAHPTGEGKYNYFDCLTRFYISEPYIAPTSYPADFRIDDIEFYHEPYEENEDQVRALTATYIPAADRLIVTWNRAKAEDSVRHVLRYSFQNIHQIGWNSATLCPRGIIFPSDKGFGMVYNTSSLPLKQKSVVYIAIKPENSKLFAQIEVPLTRQSSGRPRAREANSSADSARRVP